MSRIRVESKTPKWLPGDLRVTRLKDTVHGHLLIFKELSWQTVRIEASSTQDRSLTPLRLLTNQARCRITIKKKLSDCSILSSRLVLILDDLLWVLTDSQLKAALHFVDSLASLIKASTNLTQKSKAQKKLAVIQYVFMFKTIFHVKFVLTCSPYQSTRRNGPSKHDNRRLTQQLRNCQQHKKRLTCLMCARPLTTSLASALICICATMPAVR